MTGSIKMKLRALLIAALFSSVILPTLVSQSVNTQISSFGTVRYATWLHTDGRYIKNEYGRIVQLTGFGWQDLLISDHVSASQGSIQFRIKRHKEIGVNHFRVSISLLGRWAKPEEHPEYIPTIDEIVQECVKNDMYVYFCFHQGSYKDDGLMQALINNSAYDVWSDARDAWLNYAKEIASRYKDYPNVFGFQNWAEPGWARFGRKYLNKEGDPTAAAELATDWASFNLDVARAIHSVNPHALVVVMSPGYYRSKWVSDYYVYHPLPEPNIVYGWQDYYYSWSGTPVYESYAAGNFDLAKKQHEAALYLQAFKMLEKNIAPVMITEFAFSNQYFTGEPNEYVAMRDMFKLFSKWNAHWTMFCWCDQPQVNKWSFLESDWSTLTQNGQIAAEYLYTIGEPISPFEPKITLKYGKELFRSGFETGGYSEFNGTLGDVKIVTSPVVSGKYASKSVCPAGTYYAYADKKVPSQSMISVKFHIIPVTLPPSSGDYVIILFLMGNNMGICALKICRIGTNLKLVLSWFRPLAASVGYTYPFEVGKPVSIEVVFIKDVVGAYKVWIGGSEAISVLGFDTTSAPYADEIEFGIHYSSYNASIIYDDVAVTEISKI